MLSPAYALGLSSEEQWLVQGLMPLLDSLLLGLNSLRPAFLDAVLARVCSGMAGLGQVRQRPNSFACRGVPLPEPFVAPCGVGACSWFGRKLAGAGPRSSSVMRVLCLGGFVTFSLPSWQVWSCGGVWA